MDDTKREEAKRSLTEINSIVGTLDPLLKERAINMLWSLYFPNERPTPNGDSTTSQKLGEQKPVSVDLSSAATFFNSFKHDKPSDNALMIAAWLYSQYGVYQITPKEMLAFASKTGLTVAKRIDMTLKTAKEDGKTLFSQADNGFELTLAGEAYLQKKFGIKKGTQPRPAASAEE